MNYIAAIAAACGLVLAATGVEAKGCLKGAVVGGLAGHVVGHGAVGAAAGCAVGHHRAKEADKAAQGQNQPPK